MRLSVFLLGALTWCKIFLLEDGSLHGLGRLGVGLRSPSSLTGTEPSQPP